jgi:hypothetical protein
LLELSKAFVQEYEFQLRRLLDGALAKGNCSAVVIFGLVNFGSFFDARGKAEAMRSEDSSLFPFLEAGYKSFVSMKPEHRAGMIELATHFNSRLEVMCKRIGEQLLGTEVRLVYSDAMSFTAMDGATDLSPIDAWHPSVDGHRKLACSAYPIVYEQAQFLGWVRDNGFPIRES